MLSKEEYTIANLREHCIKTMQFSRPDSNTYKEHEVTLSIIDENSKLKYKEQKLIKKLEEDIKDKKALIELEYEQYKEYYARTGGYPNQMKFNVFKLTGEKNKAQEILETVKGN